MESLSNSNAGLYCQKCSAPIKIHESFDRISDTFPDLKSFFCIEDTFNQEIVLPVSNPNEKVLRKTIPADPQTDCGDFSDLSNAPLHDKIKVASYLFDYLSGHTELDHPLCQDCADTLLNAQDHSLKHVADEMAALQRYLDHLNKTQPVPPSPRSPISATSNSSALNKPEEVEAENNQSLETATRELEELSAEEQKLVEELKTLMLKEKELDEEIVREKENVKHKEDELDELTAEYNQEKLVLLAQEDELKALDCKLKHSKEQLDRLKKTNILNLAFNIWYEGHMGLINGLRLGRLPSNPVDWPEINAAWGQCALLLSSIAKKMNFSFQKYKIVPMGSTSGIINLSDNKELPLYHSGGVKLFGDSKFDQAMVCYLDCVGQMQNHIEQNFSFSLPYKFLEKGKIQDSGSIYSVKFHVNNEENWTKALKCVLITLKWFITTLVTRQAASASASYPGSMTVNNKPTASSKS